MNWVLKFIACHKCIAHIKLNWRKFIGHHSRAPTNKKQTSQFRLWWAQPETFYQKLVTMGWYSHGLKSRNSSWNIIHWVFIFKISVWFSWRWDRSPCKGKNNLTWYDIFGKEATKSVRMTIWFKVSRDTFPYFLSSRQKSS